MDQETTPAATTAEPSDAPTRTDEQSTTARRRNSSWGKVQVKLSTHSAGGVTASDMELAAIIERTAPWRPPTGSALRGTTKKFVDRGSP